MREKSDAGMTEAGVAGNHPPLALAEMAVIGRPAVPLDFERVYEENFSFVWRALRSLGMGEEALDDAVQDVFLVVHRRLAEFQGRSSIRTWLFAIVERVAFNQRRSRHRRDARLEPLDDREGPSDAPDPFERATESEAARFTESFLESLDPGKRAVFALVMIEGMPVPEVAVALGIPVNTVYSRIRLVRKAFQEAAALHLEHEP
jgi:RNA polymerase sigma-70 factor (ECF subfamily)